MTEDAKEKEKEKGTEAPAQGPESHPFVRAVKEMIDHLAGQPKDGYLQPLYVAVCHEYKKLVGIPDVVPDHVQAAEAAKDAEKKVAAIRAKQAKVGKATPEEERALAAQGLPHGSL